MEPRYETGTPIESNTIEGLAGAMGVNVRGLIDTVNNFNAAVDSNDESLFEPFKLDGLSTDDELAIPKSNWDIPLNKPLYVAYSVACGTSSSMSFSVALSANRFSRGITFTYAGLKTDTAAHVLNNEGLRIPGLWAVSEISGGFFAFNYPGGSGLTKGAVFGRIAGREAVLKKMTNVSNGEMDWSFTIDLPKRVAAGEYISKFFWFLRLPKRFRSNSSLKPTLGEHQITATC